MGFWWVEKGKGGNRKHIYLIFCKEKHVCFWRILGKKIRLVKDDIIVLGEKGVYIIYIYIKLNYIFIYMHAKFTHENKTEHHLG